MVFNIIALIFRDQDFFKRRRFLLTHPVDEKIIRLFRPTVLACEFSHQPGVWQM